MKCTITFSTINGEEISLALKSGLNSPNIDSDILKVLAENPDQRKDLCDFLQLALHSVKKPEITVKSLLGENQELADKGLLGNYTLNNLKEQFPTVTFPDGVEANILLIDNLRVRGIPLSGRVINSKGKELFIISGSLNKDGVPSDVVKLANFLKVRQQIQTGILHFSEDSEYYKNLQLIVTKVEKRKSSIPNMLKLLQNFLENGNSYKGKYITNENGERLNVYNILQDISNVLLEYSGRVKYSDKFVNDINQSLNYNSEKTADLSIKVLYSILKENHPEILEKLKIKSEKKFHEFFSKNSSEIETELKEVFQQVLEGEGYNTLLTTLFNSEVEFPLVFKNSTDKLIVLEKKNFRTIQEKYGIDYNTIASFEIINGDYKGYKIYSYFNNGRQWYIPCRTHLTEDAIEKRFSSQSEVEAYIDSLVQSQRIKEHMFLEFKYRDNIQHKDGSVEYADELDQFELTSSQFLRTGTIIESIDIPINKNQNLQLEEQEILFDGRSTFFDFANLIEKWNISQDLKDNILKYINNPEKITVFIYKVNELLEARRDDENAIRNIVTMIDQAQKKSYYIQSRSDITNNKTGKTIKYKYKIIPVNAAVIKEYRKQKNYPIISLMQAISTVLQEKFGVTVNMLNSSEIKEQFPNIDANTAKAFIRDGQIYINTTIAKSTDLLHEYIHLVLGVLKTNPNLRNNYEQLLLMVSSTNEGTARMKTLKERYNDISQMDLMEEVFADLFSYHIMNNLNPNLRQIFEAQSKFLKDATKIVFNHDISNLREFYGQNILQIFTRFSSDVAVLLSQPGIDFSSTKTSRMQSNWISKQIKDGNIEETCL